MAGDQDRYKRLAGEAAADEVVSDTVVGLGHGSTAIWALRRISERLEKGDLRNVVGVPCSRAVEKDARELGIPLMELDRGLTLDLTIDGADEVSADLQLIKGGGGALLREKIVAQASKSEIIVVDESKMSEFLGEKWAVPIEVVPFGVGPILDFLTELGANPKVRLKGQSPFITDQGNLIVDADFGPIKEPAALDARLKSRAGIVEHGLFIGLASEVIVAGSDGIRRIPRA